MTTIEKQIEELGTWAPGLELSAPDPHTPYWLRAKDAEHAKAIRNEQLRLLDKLAAERKPLPKCSTPECKSIAIGSPYCARCEEEITGKPYPFAGFILGETLYERVMRVLRRFHAHS